MPYRERLSVPVAWWVLATLFALSLLLAVGWYLGPVWGISVGVAAMAVAAAAFADLAVTLRVVDGVLHVGRAELELAYVADCVPLDAEQTALRGGVQADARAHLVLRPYVSGAVELTLDDPADPVPYWLVSTRRPAQLAAAVQHARTPLG